MTEYIARLRSRFVQQREQDAFRQTPLDPYALAYSWAAEGLSDLERACRKLQAVLEREQPVVWPDERIVLVRTVPVLPELFTPQEQQALRAHYTIHEQGKVCNVTPDYGRLMAVGLDEAAAQLRRRRDNLPEGERRTYLDVLLRTLECIQLFAQRYQVQAQRVGNVAAAHTIARIAHHPPEHFGEALQLLRLLHYCLWASGQYHNTLGRLDQYLWPYLERDLAQGMTQEEALELVEEFFLCCNKDSDLYPGMQQGDNGQSVVLGGRDAQGRDGYNLLSELCMTACGELRLIDPKINLRVHRDTPLCVYQKGTELTRLGLGFPQYTNDEIVVPCLRAWGYDEADAWNYSLAACWEVIIPGAGMDIPNIAAFSFPRVVNACMPLMEECADFEAVMQLVQNGIWAQAEKMTAEIGQVYMEPAPLLSLMMKGCIEQCRDISHGGRYNNYGFHGTGLSTAVDSLAAIRRFVFEERRFTMVELNRMLDADFRGYQKERHLLRYEGPKMGNDEDETDEIAVRLLDWFADALQDKRNARGGIYRPGTGSAMYYLWHAREERATPDGRDAGEPLPCNYSPSLFARTRGPVALLKSFSKPHLVRVANGGPLTVELHDSVFRTSESVEKVARYVKSFFDLGGHQMQINAVNRDTLLDAKRHPERHKNLIVRVWGWSGYFVELDEAYQHHIIRRVEMTF